MGNTESNSNLIAPLPSQSPSDSPRDDNITTPRLSTPSRSSNLNKTAPIPHETSNNNNNIDPNKKLTSSDSTTKINKVSSILPVNSSVPSEQFNFQLTEGQSRRGLMADNEYECSEITNFLYVGGSKIAESWDILKEKGITRVVNCSSNVVDNYFIDKPGMKYLKLYMVDGRQDDISWFVCEVIQFIIKGRMAGEKTLVHCEKGVSRSCSFIIAYHMWSTGASWKDSFNFVKLKRSCCAPNTAFTCNLIEFGELISGDSKSNSVIFRCSSHLPHDSHTPVLKMCRNSETRKLITPSTLMLDPRGVFVIRPPEGVESNIYVWQGHEASSETANLAAGLAALMHGVFTRNDKVVIVKAGEEPTDFFDHVLKEKKYSRHLSECVVFEDYLDVVIAANNPQTQYPAMASSSSTTSSIVSSSSSSTATSISSTSKNSSTAKSGLVELKIPIVKKNKVDKQKINEDHSPISVRGGKEDGEVREQEKVDKIIKSSPPIISRLTSPSNSFRNNNILDNNKSNEKKLLNIQGISIPEADNTNNVSKQLFGSSRVMSPLLVNVNSGSSAIDSNEAMFSRPPSRPTDERSSRASSRPTSATSSIANVNSNIPNTNSSSIKTTINNKSKEQINSKSVPNSVEKRPLSNRATPPPRFTPQPSSPSLLITGTTIPATPPPILPINVSISRGSTPLTEKLPHQVDLVRGPTPVEDLGNTPVKIPITINNNNSSNNKIKIPSLDLSNVVAKPIVKKPLLYQSIRNEGGETKRKRIGDKDYEIKYSWEAMGVYDDEDLCDTSIMILCCDKPPHYLWVGRDMDVVEAEIDSNADIENVDDIKFINWASNNVFIGELVLNDSINVTNTLVIRSGDETDTFWNAFNEGF